ISALSTPPAWSTRASSPASSPRTCAAASTASPRGWCARAAPAATTCGWPRSRPPLTWPGSRRRSPSAGRITGNDGAPLSLRPELAVEGAVVDGLDQMVGPNVGGAVEVGDGAAHAQNPVVRPRRQPQRLHRVLQERLALRVEHAVAAQLLAGHAAVEP